jgi:outer membrane protein assembly factor BamB
VAAAARADDWPMQLHDMYGTGVSKETLKAPVAQVWEYRTALAAEPIKKRLAKPAMPMDFDEFLPRVIAADGMVFVGMPDHRLLCLDAATGRKLWSYMTDGAISHSPAYWEGKVYFGSDDGYVRCVDGKSGKLLWKFRGVEDDRQMLGWLKMRSTWAITSAVIVDDGKLFFTAGLWPHDGAFLCCVDAETGTLIWMNGEYVERYHNSFAPTGIRVTRDRICVLTGIAAPAVFDRNGRHLYTPGRNSLWMRGHTLHIANFGTADESTGVDRRAEQKGPVTKVGIPSMQWTTPAKAANGHVSGNAIKVGGQTYKFDLVGGGRDFAIADGRVFIATTAGRLYCFAAEASRQTGVVAEPASKDPFAGSKHKEAVAAAAETALKEMAVQDGGFACVTDAVTGELAFELAKRRDLRVYVACGDPERTRKIQQTLLQTGFYGTRVVVRHAPKGKTNFVPYFADVVISEKAVIEGTMPENPAEMYRVAKPHRGTIMIGGPATQPEALRTYLASARFSSDANAPKPQMLDGGKWAKLIRPMLPGAGSWRCKYGDLGNTLCSQDTALRPPLGVLWYGTPGRYDMTDRHGRTIPPLLCGGVFITVIQKGVEAYDAYTGRYLWKFDTHPRTSAQVVGSNLCANRKYAFVGHVFNVVQLDLWTGEEVRKIPMGNVTTLFADEKRLYAVVGGPSTGGAINTYDLGTGKKLWTYKGASIHANCTAIGDGRAFCIPGGLTKEYREQAFQALREYYKKNGTKAELEAFEKSLPGRNVWLLVALDAETGEPKWGRPIDVTHAGDGRNNRSRTRGVPILQYRNGIVIHTESWHSGKMWGGFMTGITAPRQACAHSAEDGRLLWRRTTGHRATPIIAGDKFYPEPWGMNLKTGKDLIREHPITGKPTRWIYCRYHKACGIASASTYIIAGRGESTAYYDLINDFGLQKFHGSRPACWLNVVFGDGLMIQPPYSQGCTCKYPHPHKPTFAMRSVDRPNTSTGMFADGRDMPITPIKHLYMNLASDGDFRDKDGNLWIGSWIRPRMSLFIRNPLHQRWIQHSGGRPTIRSTNYTAIKNTDVPFAFANGVCGVKKLSLTVRGKDDGPASYTLKLGFSDPHNDSPGKRAFDVKVNGKTVLENFDIVKEAGGRDTAVFKVIKNLRIEKDLEFEFVQKTPGDDAFVKPIIQCFVLLEE